MAKSIAIFALLQVALAGCTYELSGNSKLDQPDSGGDASATAASGEQRAADAEQITLWNFEPIPQMEVSSDCEIVLKETQTLSFFDPSQLMTPRKRMKVSYEKGARFPVIWIQRLLDRGQTRIYFAPDKSLSEQLTSPGTTVGYATFELWESLAYPVGGGAFQAVPDPNFELTCFDAILSGHEFTHTVSADLKLQIPGADGTKECQLPRPLVLSRTSRIDRKESFLLRFDPPILQHKKQAGAEVFLNDDLITELCPEDFEGVPEEPLDLGLFASMKSRAFETDAIAAEKHTFRISAEAPAGFRNPIKKEIRDFNLKHNDFYREGLNVLRLERKGTDMSAAEHTFAVSAKGHATEEPVALQLFEDEDLTNPASDFRWGSDADVRYIVFSPAAPERIILTLASSDGEFVVSKDVYLKTPRVEFAGSETFVSNSGKFACRYMSMNARPWFMMEDAELRPTFEGSVTWQDGDLEVFEGRIDCDSPPPSTGAEPGGTMRFQIQSGRAELTVRAPADSTKALDYTVRAAGFERTNTYRVPSN